MSYRYNSDTTGFYTTTDRIASSVTGIWDFTEPESPRGNIRHRYDTLLPFIKYS